MNARSSLMNAWGDLADIRLYKEAKGDQGFSVFIDQAFGMLGARREIIGPYQAFHIPKLNWLSYQQ